MATSSSPRGTEAVGGSRRCICGRSQTFPVCDGAHGNAVWSCSPDEPLAEAAVAFVSGPHLANLAEWLAHQRGGLAVHRHSGPVRAAEVVVLTDGTDVSSVQAMLRRVSAAERRLLVVGVPGGALGAAFPGWPVCTLAADEPLLLTREAQRALDAAPRAQASVLPSVFVSHAVADEGALEAVFDLLRGPLGAKVFVCSDSLEPGRPWRADLEAALRSHERFCFVSSAASVASPWCAFEAGMAVALGKPTRVVSLDGTPPPGFLSHVQMSDVPRLLQRKPWLEPEDALVEAFLAAVS